PDCRRRPPADQDNLTGAQLRIRLLTVRHLDAQSHPPNSSGAKNATRLLRRIMPDLPWTIALVHAAQGWHAFCVPLFSSLPPRKDPIQAAVRPGVCSTAPFPPMAFIGESAPHPAGRWLSGWPRADCPHRRRPVMITFDARLLELLPSAVYLCDAAGVIRGFNRRATDLWGRQPQPNDTEEQFSASLRLFHPDGWRLTHSPVAEALRTGQPHRECELIIAPADWSRV